MRFLHVSTKNFSFSKESFVQPPIHKRGGLLQHDFNMDHALFMSRAYDNDDSDWLEYRRKIIDNPPPPRNVYRKGKVVDVIIHESKEDPWLNGTKHFFEVDFIRHKIYLIDSIDKLRDFFATYGVFRENIHWNSNYSQYEIDKKRLSKLKYFEIISAFIDNLDHDLKDLYNDTIKVDHIMTIRNRRNMPLVKISKDHVVTPKKFTFEFLVDLIRTRDYYANIVGDTKELISNIRTILIGINFPKIVNDGYNGVYYSRELFVPKIGPYSEDELRYHSYIHKPDIGIFPNVTGHMNDEDRDHIKNAIENYIDWLGSDSLILWNWIFD